MVSNLTDSIRGFVMNFKNEMESFKVGLLLNGMSYNNFPNSSRK